jgi:hypothetical protein
MNLGEFGASALVGELAENIELLPFRLKKPAFCTLQSDRSDYGRYDKHLNPNNRRRSTSCLRRAFQFC